MPVKVQGDNGKYGAGVLGSTCRGFFGFLPPELRAQFDSAPCH